MNFTKDIFLQNIARHPFSKKTDHSENAELINILKTREHTLESSE